MSKILKQFYLREDQVKELEKRSDKELSQAQIVRQALDKYFKEG